jgi:hypothetical protein
LSGHPRKNLLNPPERKAPALRKQKGRISDFDFDTFHFRSPSSISHLGDNTP